MAVDPDIGDEVRNNRAAFEATAKEWTEKYACLYACWNKQYKKERIPLSLWLLFKSLYNQLIFLSPTSLI